MPKTSIFYYTNNVVPPKLLNHTFNSALKHCKNNNGELILTSHFPITKNYETILLGNANATVPTDPYIIKDLSIDTSIKGYVVGRLPYSYESIIRQILFSIEKCSGENIILMEHDCLYPENYIPTIEKFLSHYDMTYCSFNIAFLNPDGYFNIEEGSFVLSMCAFKKELLKGIYSRKLELINSKKPYIFEPLLDINSKYLRDTCKNEIVVKKHICIDTFLKNQCPLDIKHYLNADGMLIGKKYYHSHPYWGEDHKYIDMIKIDISEKNKKLWSYGIGKLNY